MGTILDDIASPEVAAAIEANLCAENAVFGHYLPGAEYHEEQDRVWWITGLRHPMYNAVWLARFEGGDVDRVIEAALAPFKERGLPAGWSVGAGTRPSDLGTRLQAHGLALAVEQTGMAIDLAAVPSEAPAPQGFRLVEVRDEETLRMWRDASNRGFEASEEGARPYDQAYLAMGCSPALPWRHYLGVLDGTPVASSSLLLHAGVAGVYGVATVPAARRQGVGAAMTLAPLHTARTRGYRIGILFPSDEGLSMYRRLGFRDRTTVRHYTWSP